MADEIEQQEEEKQPRKKGLSTITIIGLIVGFLVVQIAAIYIIFTMFINPGKTAEPEKPAAKKEAHAVEEHSEEESPEGDTYMVRKIGKIVPVTCGGKDELIVNPRGSSTRYIILSVGLEMQATGAEEEGGGEHGEGGGDAANPLMIPVCDKIISTISSRTLEELQQPELRDSLRLQLRKDLQPYFGEERIRTVYFPRFIIQ
jgi:flagellar basal body-associated protein FliL